jgi:hypothetical protein
VKQQDRASQSGADDAEAADDDAGAADVDDDDDEEKEDEEVAEEDGNSAAAADGVVEEERSSSVAASAVCTRSDSASHIINSDSNSKYAHASIGKANFLSAGTLNLTLGGRLWDRRARRERKSGK